MAKNLFHLAVLMSTILLLRVEAQSIPPERPRSRPPSELTGWADWEKGAELLQRIQVPPAPPLNPAEAMKTFRLAPGYRLKLVAAEPMVINPIFFEFDPDGRIWVVEYQGYMRDLQGRGEGDSICRIVVLEDTDEDGRADKSTVFLDQLIMPRSLAFVKGGVLVAEPPKLWFCQDTNGDLRCDERVQAGIYGRAGNPQHTANGLRYGLDNWLHSSDWPERHRYVDSQLIQEPTVHRGQFGVSFDDLGRFLTCYESSALHADEIPAEYLLRNRNFLKAYQRGGGDRSQFGVNVNIARSAQEVFPVRVTPQITLGALELRNDGRLRTYTVVSGVCFYNGQQFPDDAHGNVFVPEAGGHLIGRLRVSGDIELKASRFYPAEQEFLASTDERFRPVNSRVGPDGALYVADMYHGIIEHVIFMVPWLEKQIKERRLEDGLDRGRIYRVVSEAKPIERKRPRLSSAASAELVPHLNDANGWWRLTAQRLLVERRDPAVVPALRKMIRGGGTPLGRLHALWTLDGLGALDGPTAQAATDDADERVRAAAVRLGERVVESASVAEWLGNLSARATDPSPMVRLQTALTLGAFTRLPQKSERGGTGYQPVPSGNLPDGTGATSKNNPGVGLKAAPAAVPVGRLPTGAGKLPAPPPRPNGSQALEAEDFLAKMIRENEHRLFRAAAMTGLQNRELEFLSRLLESSDWNASNAHRRQMIVLLAQAILDEANPERIARLIEFAAATPLASSWRRDAILEGMLAATPRDLQNVPPVALTTEPSWLVELTRSDIETLRQSAYRLISFFTWPGAAGSLSASVDVRPLTAEQKRLTEQGEQQFAALCAACHQPHGGGLPNVAPPLSGSEWVTGSPERLARLVLHGLYGPVEVKGETWNLQMPSFGPVLADEQLAGVLTFIRRAWGNAAEPVESGFVARIRRANESRSLPWSAEELAGPTSEASPPRADHKPSVIRADDRGEFMMPARLAATYGRELAYRPSLDILAPWRREQDVAEWRVESSRGGSYEVSVTLAADEASAGDKFILETDGSKTGGIVQSTGGYERFREFRFGAIVLRPGLNRLILRPDGPLKRELADVRALRLVPVRPAP